MLPIEQIHPMLVHFPISLVLTLLTIDTTTTLRGKMLAGRGPAATISAGVAVAAGLFSVAAYVLGDRAYDIALAADAPLYPLRLHQEFGTATAIAIAGFGVIRAALWWFQRPFSASAQRAMVAAELILGALVLITAFLGNQLVYDYGVAVSRGF